MARDRLYYVSEGYLSGPTPNGRRVVVAHPRAGRTGYELLSGGQVLARYGQDQLERDFGIAPREKRTGGQAGYPAEPVLRALWRHFVDRYNAGDAGVHFSRAQPR